MNAASELIKLAEKNFGKLTAAEKKLFRAAAKGEMADYSPRSKKPIDPANAARWGPSRVLLADRIAWLCIDRQASQLITPRGINIRGARIEEELDLEATKIMFPLYFRQCKLTADVNFQQAHIVALYMPGTHTGSVRADTMTVGGGVFLCEGFKAEGEVRLPGATVVGSLDCSNGRFINESARSLSADRLKVGGGVFLRNGFRAEGEVRLLGAAVGGSLDCDNGEFINKDAKALVADRLKTAGSVFLRNGFKAEGTVRMPGAGVGGSLSCINGQFINKDGEALIADRVKVEGSVFLRDGFRAEGSVSFVAAKIHGRFSLSRIDAPAQMMLDLNSAKIGTLHDKEDSWPVQNHLVLHGLEYEEISHTSPRDCETRIEWLRRQKDFSPQPYGQLAKVLRESGDGAGARDVLVAKNKDKVDRTELTRAEWLWYRLFGPLVGYGHKPWLAAPLALMIILSGWVFFKEGHSHGLVTPLSDSAYAMAGDAGVPAPGDTNRRISEVYPVFNSFVYSIDVFIPVVDLRQARYWLPNANRGSELVPSSSAALCWGGVLLFWLWIETACGWILTTLILVGLTGLVRT